MRIGPIGCLETSVNNYQSATRDAQKSEDFNLNLRSRVHLNLSWPSSIIFSVSVTVTAMHFSIVCSYICIVFCFLFPCHFLVYARFSFLHYTPFTIALELGWTVQSMTTHTMRLLHHVVVWWPTVLTGLLYRTLSFFTFSDTKFWKLNVSVKIIKIPMKSVPYKELITDNDQW